MTDTLPKGIWYEAPKQRFRVRKYHNKVAYLKGYYPTFEEASVALDELEEYLLTIPKERKDRRRKLVQRPTLGGTAASIRERQSIDPNILRR